MMTYYFDTFPAHPQPAPFESLTGYLIRLAEANGLQSVQGLVVACFPTYKQEGIVHIPADYQMTFWDALPRVALCSEETLRRTTFYHLAEKFNCSTRPQDTGLFLKHSLAYHFRYCPTCLVQYGYHFLPWRFLWLSGCDEHHCRLLDCCGHCGRSMPLFMKAPLKVGLCSHCRGDLRRCQAEPLPEADWAQVARQRQDLEFLLSPTAKAEPEALKHLGRRLVYWRLKQGIDARTMAQQLGIPRASLTCIEHGKAGGGANFHRYGLYTAYLGLSWQQLFAMPLPPDTHTQNRQANMKARQQREQKLVEQVQMAIATLKTDNQPVTQTAVCQLVGWSIRGLRAYPQVKVLLDQVVDEGKQQSRHNEQRLIKQVQRAIDHLSAANQPATLPNIAKSMPGTILPSTLTHNPRLRVMIEARLGSCCPPDFLEREAMLVADVQAAIAQLKANNQAVNQVAIARIVGLSVRGLESYARVKAILKQVIVDDCLLAGKATQVRQQQLLTQVQEAVRQLEASQQPFTQKDIVQLVGTSLTTLRAYPAVRQLLSEVAIQQRQFRAIKVQQRGERLLAKVQQAAETLTETGQPLTQKRIGELVGMSSVSLQTYPRIKDFLRQCSRRQKQG